MDTISGELTYIKEKIESMPKTHHVEILRILKKSPNIKLNENKSGVYINLSFLPKDTLAEITKYINYIQVQEYTIQTVESQKDNFKTVFFTDEERI